MLKQILILAVGSLMLLTTAAQPPKAAVGYFVNGKKLRDQGMFPEAMQSFKKAIVLYKSYDSAYLEWSNLYLRINKVDSAVVVLKRAVKLNPGMVTAYTALATIYKNNRSDFDSALVNYQYALKIDSSNKEVLYNIAWCYNAKLEYEKAIIFSLKILDLDVNYKPAYNEMAHAYHASKKYDEALEQFKKYSTISTCDLPLYYSGLVYMELNRFDELQKVIDQLNKINSPQKADGLKKRWDVKKNQKPAN